MLQTCPTFYRRYLTQVVRIPERKLEKEIGITGRGGQDSIKTGLTYQDLLDMPCPNEPLQDYTRCVLEHWQDDAEVSQNYTYNFSLALYCTPVCNVKL